MPSRSTVGLCAVAAAGCVALAGCGSGNAAASGQSTSGVSGAAGCSQQEQSGTTTVKLSVSPCPLKAGKSAVVDVTLTDGSGAPVKGATVKLTYGMDSMNMKGGSSTATAQGDGYRGKAFIGMPGPWDIHVDAQGGGGAAVQAHFTYTVK